MGFLSGITEEFLAPEPEFADKEIVKMQCIDVVENTDKNFIKVKAGILEGENKDREIEIMVGSNSPFAKKEFLLGFWKPSELVSGEASLNDMVGKTFTAFVVMMLVEQGTTPRFWKVRELALSKEG